MLLVQVNNLGLALGMTFKFYTSVAKELKLKVKILGPNPFVLQSYRVKNGRWVRGRGWGAKRLSRVNLTKYQML